MQWPQKKLVLFCIIAIICYLAMFTRVQFFVERTASNSCAKVHSDVQFKQEVIDTHIIEEGRPQSIPVKQKEVEFTIENSPWIFRPDGITPPNSTKTIKIYWPSHTFPSGRIIRAPSIVGCPYGCEYTQDPTIAHLVVFEGRSLIHAPLTNKTLWKRPPYQQWMYTTCDPIFYDMGLGNPVFKHLFNLTCSHRTTSDVQEILGMIERRQEVPKKNYRRLFRRKRKLAAWMVSHCHTESLREDYVQRMQTVGPVDVFGHCGPLNFAKNRSIQPFLTKHYKFYLSFENAFCKDYISEKFFKVFDDADVIPVVRGGVDYNKVFPNSTFVNAADFSSPESLMKYLMQLSSDEDAYIKMLKEKDKWTLSQDRMTRLTCRICKFMRNGGRGRIIKDIDKYIRHDPGACWNATDLS